MGAAAVIWSLAGVGGGLGEALVEGVEELATRWGGGVAEKVAAASPARYR